MNDVHLIVEKKVNKCLEPFVEKITCLLNDYENLLNEKAVIEEKTAIRKMTCLKISIIQWNFSIADIPYSGHLVITDTSL